MDTTIETASGDVRLKLAERPASSLPTWWPQVTVVPCELEDGPHPWSLRLDDPSGISALRVYSGSYAQRAAALAVLRFQRSVMPAAIVEFLTYGFEGSLLPASFLEERPDGSWSAGHLLFGHSAGIRSGAADATREEVYEQTFGPGATNLFLSYAHAVNEAWTGSGLPLRRLGQIEIVPGTRSSQVFVDFLVADGRAYHLAPEVDEDDQVWESVVQAGLVELWRMPG